MTCKNCDEVNNKDAKYCIACGSKLEANEGSVDKYFSEQRTSLIEEAKILANEEMKNGIVWFVIASLISFGSYLFTSEGGEYFVFYGAMIYGIYRLVRGFWYKLNPKSLIDKAEKEIKSGE